MKALSADSLLARLLARLAAAVCRHPRWFIYPQGALFLVCILYTVGYLKTDMNRDNLVGPNQKHHQNFLNLEKEFPQQGNGLVVVVESEQPREEPAVCRTDRREDAGGNQLLPRRLLPAKPVGHGGEGIAVRRRGGSGRAERETRRHPALHPPVYADHQSHLVFRTGQHGLPHRAPGNERPDGIVGPGTAGVDAHRDPGHRQPEAIRGRRPRPASRRCSTPAAKRTPTSPSTMAGFFWSGRMCPTWKRMARWRTVRTSRSGKRRTN